MSRPEGLRRDSGVCDSGWRGAAGACCNPPGGSGELASDGARPDDPPHPQLAGPMDLDLARLLIRDPQRGLLLRVCGESMRDAGIRDGDLLVVERDRPVPAGAIVVARLGERFTLKRLQWRRGRRWLEPAHPAYPPLDLQRLAHQQGLSAADVQIWGVAIHVIRTL